MKMFQAILQYIQKNQMEPKQVRRKEDEFETKRMIGSGSFGQVEKCKSKKDGKTYALKIISGISELFLQSIEKQAEAMKTAHSDFTMQLIDHFYDEDYENGSYIFVMPFYKRGSLSQLIKNEWKPQQILLFLYQMCQAFLSVPQNQAYWHLDLKPDNILRKNQGEYIICDFGCAKLVENNGVSQYLRISFNQGSGTTLYAAPQLILNYQGSKYSDMWSLGIILYEILYKQHPFKKGKGGMINDLSQFKIGAFKISYKAIEGYDKIIDICKKMIQPKRRLEWQTLKEFIYEAIEIPQRVTIIVSIDNFIDYMSNISTIVFGLIYYLEKNEKELKNISLSKEVNRLIDSAKLYNYILCVKAQEALQQTYSNTNPFYIFNQTKTNITIHQKQKLQHTIFTIKNFSAQVLQQSNLDDFLSAKNSFLDEIDELLTQLEDKEFKPTNEKCQWYKVEDICTFLKGKTKKLWNMDYKNKDKIKKFANDLINY